MGDDAVWQWPIVDKTEYNDVIMMTYIWGHFLRNNPYVGSRSVAMADS